MDKRTRRNLLLFFRRFRRNYQYFLNHYSGKNTNLYLSQFVNDNVKLAQTLFGDEGARLMKLYIKKVSLSL